MGFVAAFEHTVGLEGKYSNNPKDRGGPTMYGITERTARANGYADDMKQMPLSVAKAIYRKQYWDLLRLDEIDAISVSVAHELFDQAVNLSPARAASFFQRSLNVLNRQGRDYGDMAVDGVIGPVTVMYFRQFIQKRGAPGEAVMLKALDSLQGNHYLTLAEKDPTQEEFVFGWFANRV